MFILALYAQPKRYDGPDFILIVKEHGDSENLGKHGADDRGSRIVSRSKKCVRARLGRCQNRRDVARDSIGFNTRQQLNWWKNESVRALGGRFPIKVLHATDRISQITHLLENVQISAYQSMRQLPPDRSIGLAGIA